MSKNGYNQLFEYNEEAKSNYSNNYPQNNNNYNSQKNINLNNTGSNFKKNTKFEGGGKTTTLLEDDYNLISSGFKGNNIQGSGQKIPIKWRNVMKIDIDAIRNTNDLSLLSSYLENFLYSTISEDDLQAVPEENIVKLIKILQFSNEYLLSSRQNLNENIINLQGQKQGLINEHQKLDNNIINQKEYINKANKEKKLRMKEIADYKNVVSSLVEGGVPFSGYTKITDINVDINKNYNYNQSKLRGNMNGYKCKYCTGKIFSSEFELKKHLTDIHLIEQFPDEEYNITHNIKQPQTASEINITVPPLNNNNINNNNNNRELEKKLNEMRLEMQNYMHKTEINELKNQLRNQQNYNNEPPDYTQEIQKMGNTFNDTLKQVLTVMVKNNNNQEKQKIIINQKSNNYDNDLKNDEEINNLKKKINETKSIYERKRKEYDEKISDLKNEINILNNQKVEINIDLNKKKDIIPKNIVLVPEQKEPISYLKKNVRKLGKSSKFHSAFLESDHDDSDNERKRNQKIIRQLKEKTKLYEIIINENRIINEKEDDDNIDNNLRTKNFLEGANLDDFYKRYIRRDNKYLQNSQFNYYLKEVLPNEFSNEEKIKKRAKKDISDKLKKTAQILKKENELEEPLIEVKDLKKKDVDYLLKLINNTFRRMDLAKDTNRTITPYYISLKELLDLPEVEKTCDGFAKLHNEKYNENTKSNKLRAPNKRNIYNVNNIKKDISYDLDNNLPKEKKEYEDIQYFSGGSAFSGQKNEIFNNDILKNANATLNSNQFNNTENQNQFINTNNNNAQNTNYSSSRTGPFPTIINQNEEKEENPPLSSAIEGQGFSRDNDKKYNNLNEEEAK